jgi:nitrite reductase/ring-hydroxylating ferredoxin subunit
MKYLTGLAGLIDGDGSVVFDRTRVVDVDGGEPCKLQTDRGTVTADDVVLATHTPIGLWLSLHPRLVPYRSYVMALRAVTPLPSALFWDADDPYHYIRAADSPSGQLLIIGGADHKTGHCENPSARFDDLERFARDRFEVRSIDHRWSSEFFEPSDGLPYIGRSPTSSHVFVATGFSGTGLTFGTVAAMLISDQILGRPNSWEDLFTSNRLKPLASMARTLNEAGSTLKGLVVDRVLGADGRGVDDLAPREGRVISQRGQRLAVYRDERMRLHVHSASCPHMGCIVAWNDAERTWDCPCHGSCFHATGEVVHGPATAPLTARELLTPGHARQDAASEAHR